MSVLFATPCYGGQMMVEHAESAEAMLLTATEIGLDCDWHRIWNESLIQRGRNGMAAHFADQTDYERLMFIDSDIQFTPDDVAKLWNMDADVAVGIYAMKKKGKDLYACWHQGKLVTDLDQFGDGPVSVDYAGTGFMMIKRHVFEKFREAWPEKAHWEGGLMARGKEPAMANPDGGFTEGLRRVFAWFDPRVDQEEEIYLSEDYAFCKDWRSLGGEILCDPTIRLKHWGRCAFGKESQAEPAADDA